MFMIISDINVSGIYCIINTLNNKLYIGYATNIRKRFNEHLCKLRGNTHENDRLQKSWNKYGEDNFAFDIVEEIPIEQISYLAAYEDYWATLFDSHNREYGFNLAPTNPYGYRVISEETRKKISLANKGKHLSEEHKQKISKSNFGKTITEETRERLRKCHTGFKMTEETKKRMSESMKALRKLRKENEKK